MAIGIRLDSGGQLYTVLGDRQGTDPTVLNSTWEQNRTERAALNDAPRCAGQHLTFTQKFAYSPNLSEAQFRTWRGILQLESKRIGGRF